MARAYAETAMVMALPAVPLDHLGRDLDLLLFCFSDHEVASWWRVSRDACGVPRLVLKNAAALGEERERAPRTQSR
jgi:hypothetical protein